MPRRSQLAALEEGGARDVGENEDFQEFSPRDFYPADDKVIVLGTYAMTVRKSYERGELDVRPGEVAQVPYRRVRAA